MMKTITRRAATVVAAGALGLGGLAVAAPALAGAGPFGPGPAPRITAAAESNGMGFGGGMGFGPGSGSCQTLAEQGSLTAAQRSVLASMAQEEKLAHDVYAAFAARYDAAVFDHIATAETHHLIMIRTLLQRYGVADPTANQPDGTFTDPAFKARYDKLVAQGKASLSEAMAAAQQAERDDIAALEAARGGLTAPDVKQVYANLLAASERHLAAFTRWPAR